MSVDGRADKYSFLMIVVTLLESDPSFKVFLFVKASVLADDFGWTFNEIKIGLSADQDNPGNALLLLVNVESSYFILDLYLGYLGSVSGM